MNLELFKSVLDQDRAPIVLCTLDHTIVYMNEASIIRYGKDLTGTSLKACHNAKSNEMIDQVVAWFKESVSHNIIFTSRNEKENKDVYMVALRNSRKELIGYYEKHEFRTLESDKLYNFFE